MKRSFDTPGNSERLVAAPQLRKSGTCRSPAETLCGAIFPVQSGRFSGGRRKFSGPLRVKSCGDAVMERKFRSKAERDNICKSLIFFHLSPPTRDNRGYRAWGDYLACYQANRRAPSADHNQPDDTYLHTPSAK